ncbi:hypothetical protein RhiirC2_790465 [Rhizophagus irregularis]|uniref:Uncharacterized protein n=1 Tax=Rhizophagus irregularis TaxID=588596 RepID=A0A2N1ML56_9GLOM|nr:hypothetical protein RhiirC2_790465 [Rhizophagus irregularis]
MKTHINDFNSITNMFAQLYIIYFFFLVSAVVGIPVVNLQNKTFSTDSPVPTRPKCTDPNNAKYKSSACATRKSVRVSCTAVDTNFSCGDGESCVNITSNDAFCVDDNSAQEWENNHDPEKLVAGITTYSTTGDPIVVAELIARYDDKNSDYAYQKNNYTFTIKQENFSKNMNFCFIAHSSEEVQAVASLAYVLM